MFGAVLCVYRNPIRGFVLFFLLIFLLGANAEPDCKDWMRENFWKQAGPLDVTRCLSMGKNLEVRDKNGWAPLHIAASSSTVETVKVLLDYGADIEARDKDGWTPLHVAVDAGNTEAGALLLAHKMVRKGTADVRKSKSTNWLTDWYSDNSRTLLRTVGRLLGMAAIAALGAGIAGAAVYFSKGKIKYDSFSFFNGILYFGLITQALSVIFDNEGVKGVIGFVLFAAVLLYRKIRYDRWM